MLWMVVLLLMWTGEDGRVSKSGDLPPGCPASWTLQSRWKPPHRRLQSTWHNTMPHGCSGSMRSALDSLGYSGYVVQQSAKKFHHHHHHQLPTSASRVRQRDILRRRRAAGLAAVTESDPRGFRRTYPSSPTGVNSPVSSLTETGTGSSISFSLN
ncbi:hypothetical protein V8E36_007503 [Tilletia maclaganii]